MAFTNEGEPGGQSTGSLLHNDESWMGTLRDFSTSPAPRMTFSAGLPKFEPSDTTTSVEGAGMDLFEAEDMLHRVKSGGL